MDIAMCSIDTEAQKLYFAGAYNPLWIFRKGKTETDNVEFIEIKGDRMPIGVFPKENTFTNHEIQLENNDEFYIFSDGYESQFGGEKGDKLKAKRMQQIIMKIQKNNIIEQKQLLEQELIAWQGKHEQVDDILVVGIKMALENNYEN